jgi:hypothetical protein
MIAAIMMTMILEMSPGPWQTVNDGVMGGISSSRMAEADGVLSFEGELSLENNGGFASVRRLVDTDLSQVTGVRLEVRGDQRTYQFRLRQRPWSCHSTSSFPYSAAAGWRTRVRSYRPR